MSIWHGFFFTHRASDESRQTCYIYSMATQRNTLHKTPPPNTNRDTHTSSPGTDAILESISDGVFTVDHEWRIASFNHAAETITGIARTEAIGKPCNEVFRSNMCETGCALKETLSTNTPVIGRTGYIIKSDGSRVPISVSTAVLRNNQGEIMGGAETFRDLSEIEVLREALGKQNTVGDILSVSPAMRPVLDLVHALAPMETTVLITGETGSGKEVVARAIHSGGQRASLPFVALNCGALPDTLLESELFGHVKGAFTGAEKDHPGVFEQAGEGTLFLDEIGEISPAMQIRLLRVIQERQFIPLGGTGSRPVRARIIAATNRDLAARVREGHFREDLYFRINVITIEIPPLRKRREDIPLLADKFLSRAAALTGRPLPSIDPDAMARLVVYDWPGNIRELQNKIERGAILSQDGVIRVCDLALEESVWQPEQSSTPEPPSLRTAASEGSKKAIIEALHATGGRRRQAAALLGIHPATLFRRMRALGTRFDPGSMDT